MGDKGSPHQVRREAREPDNRSAPRAWRPAGSVGAPGALTLKRAVLGGGSVPMERPRRVTTWAPHTATPLGSPL